MMTERQRKFREQYVANISPWYNGLLHIVVTYGVGIAAIAWCVSRMQDSRWEWLLMIPVAIAGNFVEWGMHQHVMHRLKNVWAIRAIYDRHTRQHHQYFTDNDVTIHSTREFRIVFFPWRLLVTLGAAGGLLGWLTSLIWNANAGYVVFITMMGHYLVYETLHFFCHIPENRWLRYIPFVNTIRRHHTVHHNMGVMMHVNMNLTFPIADWALGTSDLNRGLLGHLFNGYDDKHMKEELKPIMARFRTAETQAQRCTLEGPVLDAEEARIVSRAVSHA
ncbi:MAG TPA: hypothetical protein VFE23_00110 [Usitatibacter sp.]|jgi:hypothetical protein|nr:hypothetical protein [Usitatibacter sp.]